MNLATVIEHKNELLGRTLKTVVQQKEFTIVDVSRSGISVRPQNSKSDKDRLIRALEVNLMGQSWEAFKAGSIGRTELANGDPPIFNTSYLQSIFLKIESRIF